MDKITEFMTPEEVKLYNMGKTNTEYYFLTALKEWYYHDYSNKETYNKKQREMANKIINDIVNYFEKESNNE